MSSTLQTYVQRPDGTALWLPAKLLTAIGAKHGDKLTPRQFNDAGVQELIARRYASKTGGVTE